MNFELTSATTNRNTSVGHAAKRIAQQWSTRALAIASVLALCAFATLSAQAQTYKEKILYTFTDTSDGGMLFAGLISDAKGNLYGTTPIGGTATGCNGSSCGNLFRVSKAGKENNIHSFKGTPDGAIPLAGLISDARGNLYGTTSQGGTFGAGTVYEVTKAGTEKRLYNFKGKSDGAKPCSGLLADGGNLYGITIQGGKLGFGTVFKVTNRKESVVYNFTQFSFTGTLPCGSLISDMNGSLYGTTYVGGASGLGSVFKVTKTGKEVILHSFTGSSDGAFPVAGLVSDGSNLYGTASEGGDLTKCGGSGCGVVFKLSASNNEIVLHPFHGKDGEIPYGTLIQDAQGNLYGTTELGGAHGFGTVFKVTKGGKETVLHSFAGGNDGVAPYAGLLSDSKGDLYGTTYEGGGDDAGIIFKLIP